MRRCLTVIINALACLQTLAYKRIPSNRPELSTEFFLVPELFDRNLSGSVATVISVPAPNRNVTLLNRSSPLGKSQPAGIFTQHQPNHHHQQSDNNVSLLRERPWAFPLIATSIVAMLLMAGFEVFVLLKARAAAPSRRHLFLGQALLLGLFIQAGLSAASSLTPNPLSCAAIRLVGLPAALVFAALLVKCVFLLSLNSGVYLPAPYQALVLIFAVSVEVAIIAQWFYGEPPAVIQVQNLERNSASYSCCKTPLGQTLASLGYPGGLLTAVVCLAIRARGVTDNYREASFIGVSVGLSTPIWIVSAVGALIVSERDREAWLSYGLLSTSIFIFLIMFLSKGRQLAALGREGPMITTTTTTRERDETLSSLPGSGYSPSFFHFKPEASIKRKMHYHSADRVALVSSGMPGCSACRHNTPVYPDYPDDIHGPMETFILPPGMYLRPEDSGNLYTTLSANPNVFFQRAHPEMMY